MSSRFSKGFTRGNGGVFACSCCGRNTRDVNGGNGGVQLCPQCYEAAGIENEIMDGDSSNRDLRLELLREAEAKGGRVPRSVWEAV